MSCFILLCIYWIILIIEQLFIHGPHVKKVLRTKSISPFILDDKHEKSLYIFLVLRAFIMVLQLFLGPLVDGLSFGFTSLAIVLGWELFGMGFGALITIHSIQTLINTKRHKQNGSTGNEAVDYKTDDGHPTEANKKWYRNQMAIIIPVVIFIGVIIGLIYYTKH